MAADDALLATRADASDVTARARGPGTRDFPGTAFLATRRLRLRGLCLADVPALRAMNEDVDVSRALVEPCPSDDEGVAATVQHANLIYVRQPGLGVWHAADLRGEFVGVFSLMPMTGGDVELGARLRRSSWGRLYSIEGSRALIEHAFTRLDLPRLMGLCHPDNKAVPVILQRLGFHADGETRHFGHRALRFELDAKDWRRSAAARHNGREDAQRTEDVNE